MENIKRQKIDDRLIFSYEERLEINQKSDNKCCHCGKVVYPGYGATIDHFIPLNKGGTNRKINLVMLCKECNEDKTDKIVDPNKYLKYLKPKYLEEVNGYFDSYIMSFDYLDRTNILCFNEYEFEFNYKFYPNRNNKKIFLIKKINLSIKRLDKYDDLTKIKEFYVSCIKKNDLFYSDEYVDLNIKFWLDFGCIYYIEQDGLIKTMFVLTIQQQFKPIILHNDISCGTLMIRIFNNYNNTTQNDILYISLNKIVYSIFKEQKIPQLPINIKILIKDSSSKTILEKMGCKTTLYSNSIQTCTIFKDKDFDIENKHNILTSEFFDKFKTPNMDSWFIDNNCIDMKWIGDDIIQFYDRELTDEDIKELLS